MRGTQQNWNLVWNGDLMTTTPNPGPTRIGAVAQRAPAASMEDSRPQAILKFHRLSSLDYRVRHELLVGNQVYLTDECSYEMCLKNRKT